MGAPRRYRGGSAAAAEVVRRTVMRRTVRCVRWRGDVWRRMLWSCSWVARAASWWCTIVGYGGVRCSAACEARARGETGGA